MKLHCHSPHLATAFLSQQHIHTMKRTNISSGAPWENLVGYSRAVCIGNMIEVAGTTAVVDNEVHCKGDAAGQTRLILEKIKAAIEEAGASMRDVIRTRIFTTDISRWEEIGKVHGEYFRDIKPATTMVEVRKLIDPEMLVEIEASAVMMGQMNWDQL